MPTENRDGPESVRSHRTRPSGAMARPCLTLRRLVITGLAAVSLVTGSLTAPSARAAVGVALAVEQLNDDDRRCRLSDEGMRAAAEAGLHDRAIDLVEARSPYLFYLEAGGIPTGDHCAYTLIVRLLHVERLATPHPLFGEARATLICSDGLRGLDQPGVGIDRVLAGLTRIVSNCTARIIGQPEAAAERRSEPPIARPGERRI